MAELLSRSPDLAELLGIWEAQLTVTSALRSTSTSAHFPHEEWDPESCAFAQAKIDEVIVALLLLLAEMLPLLASLPGQEQKGASVDLVLYLIDRRLKVMQQTSCELPVHLPLRYHHGKPP